MKPIHKYLFLMAGFISMIFGFIGMFLPILPTTPFMILAAFCFSKSSEKLHKWLLSRPHIGKLIIDWEKHGVIRMKAKVASTIVIIPLFSYTLIFVDVNNWVKAVLVLTALSVLSFIWSRPSKLGTVLWQKNAH